MKGIVFTEFLEMVEDQFSYEVADAMIQQAELPHDGAYTSVGTYDHRELVRMVVALGKISETPLARLIHAFGLHLFGRFVVLYPAFFTGMDDALVFLSGIEARIHTEVRKLYPDAELPRFDIHLISPDHMEMIYRSERCFGDLAHGLIEACIVHFGGGISLERRESAEMPGAVVTFVLRRQTA